MRAGDAEFEGLVVSAWPQLRQAAYALTGDSHEAEDLLQGVLAGVYARWPKVRRDNPVAYVRRALVNAYVDSWRRRRTLRIDATETVPDMVSPDSVAPVEDRLDLEQLLARLSARERTMVVMRYYLDQSEAEVADSLGCSIGTVKSTCSRALARLRLPALTAGEDE